MLLLERGNFGLNELLGLFRGPNKLELKLLLTTLTIMLDVEHRIGWNVQAFTGNLDGKGSLRLDGVCQAAKLGDELRAAIRLGEIAI